MATRGSKKKIANRLMAVSSAAVLAVYAAGYTRTRTAADKLETQFGEHSRPASPGSVQGGPASRPGPAPMAAIQEVKADIPVSAPSVAAAPAEAPAAPEKAVQMAKVEAPPMPVAEKPVVNAPAVPAAAEAVVTPQAPAVVTPAPAPAPPVDPYKAVVAAAAGPWKDGSYSGWGSCRHGDLEVTATIEGGKIVSAKVTNCQTRYSCDIIDKLPPQVIKRQSPDVDYVGGATQSTDAYYWALVVALGKAH